MVHGARTLRARAASVEDIRERHEGPVRSDAWLSAEGRDNLPRQHRGLRQHPRTTQPARHTMRLTRALAVAFLAVTPLAAQTPTGTVIDEAAPSGANYDKAEFRLWYPSGVATFRGILVLVPGSNGDGRPMAQDTVWQAFAAKNNL